MHSAIQRHSCDKRAANTGELRWFVYTDLFKWIRKNNFFFFAYFFICWPIDLTYMYVFTKKNSQIWTYVQICSVEPTVCQCLKNPVSEDCL